MPKLNLQLYSATGQERLFPTHIFKLFQGYSPSFLHHRIKEYNPPLPLCGGSNRSIPKVSLVRNHLQCVSSCCNEFFSKDIVITLISLLRIISLICLLQSRNISSDKIVSKPQMQFLCFYYAFFFGGSFLPAEEFWKTPKPACYFVISVVDR